MRVEHADHFADGRSTFGTSGESWTVYPTRRDAIAAALPAETVCAFWRGGYILSEVGHPLPEGAEIDSLFVIDRWREIE